MRKRKDLWYKLVLLALALVLTIPLLSACNIKGGSGSSASAIAVTATSETEIYNNGNVAGVINNPTGGPTTFTITGNYKVTLITDYHWNNGKGASAGTIGLKDTGGKVVGTWPVTVRSGVYWDVTPQIIIGPGTYTVVDSDPSTWAQNSQSKNQGITDIKGLAITYASAPQGSSGSSNSTSSSPHSVTGTITTGQTAAAATVSVPSNGGTISITQANTPITGLQLVVPANAYSDTRQFKISYAPIEKKLFR